MQRSRQRLFAWVAIFAMMLSALAPAISRAMGPDENGRYFVQVCSAAGIEWVAVSAAEAEFYADVETRDDGTSGKGGGLSLDQCPLLRRLHHDAAADPGFSRGLLRSWR